MVSRWDFGSRPSPEHTVTYPGERQRVRSLALRSRSIALIGSGSPILLAGADFGAGVAWSPDGRRIAYVRDPGGSDPTGTSELVTAAPDGSDVCVAASAPGRIRRVRMRHPMDHGCCTTSATRRRARLTSASAGAASAPVRLTQQPFDRDLPAPFSGKDDISGADVSGIFACE